ncbi:GMP synthase [glutamine-hydrolyzing] [Fusarium venenatum]|uniref:GMP synthase n=1 Tax=Fusarium venenatum TaxID=56646 RepID=UPI001DC1D1DD|nr:GMP synthase [glutamine-hydrolyzing] [Fusarium venenatum]KAH7003192.1 GMP synthase [Fusarium venenatum]
MSDSFETAAPPHATYDTVLVLDMGSQTSHLILRRLRSLGVYSEMLPCTQKIKDLGWKPVGVILSGGPSSVYADDAPGADPAVFELGVPVLGVCYGNQHIAWRANPKSVAPGVTREYGETELTIHKIGTHGDRLFEGLGDSLNVVMSHFDKVVQLPDGFKTIATTKNSEFAGIAHETEPIFGIQFHPEISHTEKGTDIIRNFAVNICGARPEWKMDDFSAREVQRIRKLVGDKAQVIGAVSGGVDSTVAAKLMKEAIGDRFHAILVDQGLMRLNECEQVKETLDKHLGINLTVVDGSELFLGRLAGVTEPEAKRKIIGGTFIDLFEIEALRIEKEAENTDRAGKVEWFLQGTLYADIVESLSFKGAASSTIKSHHNAGGLPARMQNGEAQLKLLEPLRELFKDEVRAFGRQLGIHEELIGRHPFPGPGLGIRIIGEVTPERVEIVRKADHIFISMIREAGIYDEVTQAYAALDSSRAVGVQGDARVYGYICILRAVTSLDMMSAEPYEFKWSLLKAISRRIVNEVDGIARVVYDTTSKPPGTIELE